MNLIRRALLFSLLGAFGVALVLQSGACTEAARSALTLCAQTLIPTLFPFFVLSSLVVSCLGTSPNGVLSRFMQPLFGVGGAGASALALGLLGGYPVGARTVGELYRRGELSRGEAEQLLAFCGNCGAGFILGFCGAGVFQSPRVGAYLYLVHVASALLTGLLLRRRVSHAAVQASPTAPQSFAAAFPRAVLSALTGILNVCAFVVLFMVLVRILSFLPLLAALPEVPRACLIGFWELTNGIAALPQTHGGFLACAVMLGWGGLSVHAQTLMVLEDTGLSLRRYFLGKTVQALLSIPLALLAAGRVFG